MDPPLPSTSTKRIAKSWQGHVVAACGDLHCAPKAAQNANGCDIVAGELDLDVSDGSPTSYGSKSLVKVDASMLRSAGLAMIKLLGSWVTLVIQP